MHHIKYLLLTLALILITACNSTKEPKEKKEKKEVITKKKITKVSTLGVLNEKQKIVKQELDIYLEALSTFNTDAIVDMTYPKLFWVIDPDLFRQYIASMMNSTELQIVSYDTNITRLSQVTSFTNDTEFAQVNYQTTIKIHFLKSHLYATDEQINFLYDSLIHKYGTENIYINKEDRIIQVKELKKLLIIKEKDTEWKFVGDDHKYRKQYPNFLPPEILKLLDV